MIKKYYNKLTFSTNLYGLWLYDFTTCYTLWHFGDWSLITGRGGLQTAGGGGGISEVLPLQKKGGADFFLAVLKGGGGGHKKL